MEIKKASVYGFGKWVHFDIEFAKGMCIYGENESGKSTIHQFILFMLFGLPPKQRTFFQPKMGAPLGGRMTIIDEDVGEFTIERLDHVKNGAATCYTPDGMEYDEAWLKDRLKGTTLATYQSIFSFSAMDLSGITNMSDVDLSEMILGIGLTGSTEIYQVEKQLENKLGDLFKPFGKKPKMNQQLDQLEKRFATLIDYKENEATYREKKLREAQLEEKIEKMRIEWGKEKRHLSILERHIQAFPILMDYKQYNQQLQTYENDDIFPENGISRLENLKESLLPLQSELAILRDNEEKYQKKLNDLQYELAGAELYGAVEKLRREKERYLDDKKELERIEHHIEKKRLEIEAELDRLNIGLELEDLLTVSIPFHLEKTWTQVKNEVEQIKFEKEQLHHELNQLKRERNHLYHQLEEVEKYLLPDEMQLELNEKLNRSRELDVVERLQEDEKRKQKSWNKRKREKEKNIHLFLISSLAVAIILSVIGFITKIEWLPMISFIILLLGLGQWLFGRKSIRELDEMKSISISSFDLPYSQEEIQEAEMKVLQHNKHVNEMESLKEKLEQNDLNRVALRDKMKQLEAKDQKVNNLRHDQIQDYPFLQNVDTVYWPEFFHTMKQLVTISKVYLQQIEEKEELQKRIDRYKQKLDDFFKKYNWESTGKVNQQIEALESFLIEQQEISQLQKQYAHFLDRNREDQQKIQQRIETYEQEKNALFKVANVVSEEAYYQKARKIEERNQLEDALGKTQAHLERIFPNESWRAFLSKQETEEELEWRHNEIENRVKELEAEMLETDKELAKIVSQLETMESESDYSDHLHQYELEQEELNKLAKKWAVYKVAKDLLKQTIQAYQEKHLQQVLEKTSNYFERITGGKYRTIYPPSEKKVFQVETDEGMRYEVHELSKGTMDQLYVSLRLAIGQILSKKSQLPFIIDDAFLHFDSVRTKRIIEILEEISTSRQVVLFTCKEDVRAVCTSLERISLENSIRII